MNRIYHFFILIVLVFGGVWLVNSFFQTLSPAAAFNPVNSEVIPARWDIQCIECPEGAGATYIHNDRSLRIDSNGTPHVAYGSTKLYHGWYDGSQWQQELIDVSMHYFEHVTFALDTQDRPSASYYDLADHSMKFAYRQNNGWITETVPTEGFSRPLALTIDNTNQPHVIFEDFDFIDVELRHAWRGSNGLWQHEAIAVESLSIVSASLVFDSAGQMHVTYMVDTNGNSGRGDYYLKYAWYEAGAWQIEDVIRSGPWGFYHSLAIDENDRLHISFMDGVAQTLQYGWRENNMWQFETVDNAGKVGIQPSIAVDSQGQVHISYFEFLDEYFDFRNIKLKYARYDGQDWTIETVTTEGANFYGTSLALREEQPYIVYYNVHASELRLALRDVSGWESSLIRADASGIGAISFALDSNAQPHFSYVSGLGTTCKLWYAYLDGVNWQYTLLSTWVGCYYQRVSLAIDSDNRPHIVYWQNDMLKYVWFDGAEWQIEVSISGVSGGGWKIPLALDPADQPHILYRPETRHITHGWFDGTTWQEEVIYNNPDGWPGDIAVDSDGRVHVTFFEAGDGEFRLYHAWKDGDVWQIEAVNEPGEGGEGHDLELDALNRPHIAYIDSNHEFSLIYTWKDGSQWQSVPTMANATQLSLALDSDGQPHISYWNEIEMPWQVRYVYTKDANWYDELISNNAAYAAIAIDSLDRPHIAFHSNGGLMYGKRPLPLALDTAVSPIAEVQADDIMTYTLTFSAPELNVQFWNPLPDTMTYITGTLTTPAVYSPTAHAISWQGTLLANEDMTFQFQATSALSGTELIPPLVNTTWLTETTTGEGISRTQIVNGKLRWLPIINLPND